MLKTIGRVIVAAFATTAAELLNRPGANVTGVTNLTTELAPKRLQLLRELIPNAAVVGFLADPAFPRTRSIADLQAAARTLGLQLFVNAADSETAFATFLQQRVGAVLVSGSSFRPPDLGRV
jgi:putative ABC transport system substrate-binding protein